MSQVMKDSALAIKLFGKTIGLASFADKAVTVVSDDVSPMSEHRRSFADTCSKDDESRGDWDSKSRTTTSISSETTTTSTTSDEEKTTCRVVEKKNEKMIPCPRCKSMDTKFCYYNNYNTKQPRHFCKKCQRYWTAGGTMRNVPVGSGRRKNSKTTCNANVAPLQSPAVTYYPAAFRWGLGWGWGGSNHHHVQQFMMSSSPPTSVLGKHSREGGALFQSKDHHSHRAMMMMLQPNPAALSRSLNFHETL